MLKWPRKLVAILLPLCSFFLCLGGLFAISTPVYADPTTDQNQNSQTQDQNQTQDTQDAQTDGESTEEADEEEATNSCYDQMGSMGWLICPLTTTISGAVDTLYSLIQDLLVIQPLTSNSDSPLYVIWVYIRNLTNIVFIILLLVVVFSQLTGVGFNNYNIKKVLPRIVIAAILTNLSFIICSLAVDISNIVGVSLRGFCTSIQESLTTSGTVQNIGVVDFAQLAAVFTGGTVVAGLTISATTGLTAFIFMLIPTVVAALIAVIIGLITIALRQGVVSLLVVISPLALVCYMLPNTEKWFKRWRDIFITMLVFYPLFSLLFGACALAGWILIVSATNVFWVILGLAVQVLPLFFCWSLMKMSSSVLGTVSDKLNKLTATPQAGIKAWGKEQQQLRRAEHFARASKYNPGRRINDFFANRKADRADRIETAENELKSRRAEYVRQKYHLGGDLNAPLSKRGARSLQSTLNTEAANNRVKADQDRLASGILDDNVSRRGANSNIPVINTLASRSAARQSANIQAARTNAFNAANLARDAEAVKYGQDYKDLLNYEAATRDAINNPHATSPDALRRRQEISTATGNLGRAAAVDILNHSIAAKQASYEKLYGDTEKAFSNALYPQNAGKTSYQAVLDHNIPGFAASVKQLNSFEDYESLRRTLTAKVKDSNLSTQEVDAINQSLSSELESYNSFSPENIAYHNSINNVLFGLKGKYILGRALAEHNAAKMDKAIAEVDAGTISADQARLGDTLEQLLTQPEIRDAAGNITQKSGEAEIRSVAQKISVDKVSSQNDDVFNTMHEYGQMWWNTDQSRSLLFGKTKFTGKELYVRLNPYLSKGGKITDNDVTFDSSVSQQTSQALLSDILHTINPQELANLDIKTFSALTSAFATNGAVDQSGKITFDTTTEAGRAAIFQNGFQNMAQQFNGNIDFGDTLRRLNAQGKLSNMHPEIYATLNAIYHLT